MTGLLAIYTATDVCSVALSTADSITEKRIERPRAHAEQLVPIVREICGGDFSGLTGISIAAGPGSFTGLRIGLSAAKGLVYALDVPLYAVSTLASFACSASLMRAPGSDEAETQSGSPTPTPELKTLHTSAAEARTIAAGPYISAMRARSSELYAGMYAGDEDGKLIMLERESVVPDDQFESWVRNRLSLGAEEETGQPLMTGPDASSLADGLGLRFQALDTRGTAVSVLRLTESDPNQYLVGDPTRFEPYYCKDFVARRPTESIFDRLPF